MKAGSTSVLFLLFVLPFAFAEQIPPVGVEDTYSVRAGSTLNVNAWNGVLSNDYDENLDTLSVGAFNGPVTGTLHNFLTSGAFSYEAPSSFVGIDTFQYRVWDGSHYSPFITVTIHVIENLNQAPVAVSEEYQTNTNRNLKVEVPGALLNDYDPDEDPIQVANFLPPLHGQITRFLITGAFTYEPDSGYSGTDVFWYQITDENKESEYMPIIIYVGNTSGEDIVTNGSFDLSDGTPETALSWRGRKISGEKRICDALTAKVAVHGNCAFRFEGSIGEASRLQQLNYSTPNLIPGDILRLETFVRAEAAENGATLKVVITYKESIGQDSAKIRIPAGTYPYTPFSSKALRVRGTISSIKVEITNRMRSGSFTIDKVSLIARQ